MINNTVKLVIWDLDDSFWEGTISEGTVKKKENVIELVKKLNRKGIVNSICSKNDFEVAKAKLIELDNIWEMFVFPSINWEPKGERIKGIINSMNLRELNVLFIDDNEINLNEAKFYCPNLQVLNITDLNELADYVCGFKDETVENKRLNQYKVLEKKSIIRQSAASNEDFLKQSEIEVRIILDCDKYLNRIEELISRTNQLNFTKIRSTRDEIEELLKNDIFKNGLVAVRDKFGDYGIVGYYCLDKKKKKLIHFLFSCRTLGMGIEQYIYQMLNYPEISTIGDVSSSLQKSEIVNWIRLVDNEKKSKKESDKKGRNISKDNIYVFMKGPCDVSSVLAYMKSSSNVITEFNFVDPMGVTITGQNHSTMIVQSLNMTDSEINSIIEDAPFYSRDNFKTNILKSNAKIYIYSMLSDGHDGLYIHNKTGLMIPFSSGNHSLCEEKNWNKFIKNEYSNHDVKFTNEILKNFSDNFEFKGFIEPKQCVKNINIIRKNLPKDSLLILLLGSEIECPNSEVNYKGIHIRHRMLNESLLKEFADCADIKMINMTNYINTPEDYRDNIVNHYARRVYYQLAEDIVDIINQYDDRNPLRRGNIFDLAHNKFVKIINKIKG